MNHMTLLAAMLAASLAHGPQSSAPRTRPSLAQLMTELPEEVRSKHFNLGPFSDAVTKACDADPASFASSIPIFEQDLEDSDPQVRFTTIAALIGLTMQTGDTRPLRALEKKIESITLTDTYDNRFIALNARMDPTLPLSDEYTQKVEAMLKQKDLPERLTIVSGSLLMFMRPSDPVAQKDVIDTVSDLSRPQATRCQLLNAAASEIVGPEFTEYVIRTVNASQDKDTRNCSIKAAEKIGPRAVSPVSNTLRRVADDPDESAESKAFAKDALKRIQITPR